MYIYIYINIYRYRYIFPYDYTYMYLYEDILGGLTGKHTAVADLKSRDHEQLRVDIYI